MNMSTESLLRLLKIISDHDCCANVSWHFDNSNIIFDVNCNDVFAWAVAECVEIITDDDINLFETSLNDAGELDGCTLYCARKLQCRPQGACYNYIERKNWQLFNACGPEREINFGNPYKPGEYKTS
jgi:hypothetical protein